MGLKPDQGMIMRRMLAVSWVWEYVLAAIGTAPLCEAVDR